MHAFDYTVPFVRPSAIVLVEVVRGSRMVGCSIVASTPKSSRHFMLVTRLNAMSVMSEVCLALTEMKGRWCNVELADLVLIV